MGGNMARRLTDCGYKVTAVYDSYAPAAAELAKEIKADLGISDAEIGFLYGTVFAVFYAVFGIPLGRLADSWIRTNLISIGLLFWSLMTALSGTARSFASLATYRIGVGIYYLWPWLLGASVLSTHARRQRQ